MNRRLLAAFAAAALLTACGSDNDSDKDSEGSDSDNAAAVSTIAEQLGDETGFDADQSECIAQAMVDDVGVETLQEGGLLDEEFNLQDDATSADLSEDDAAAAADAFTDCVDMQEFMRTSLGGEVTDEQMECIEGTFTEDDFHAVMKAGFMGDESTAEEMFQNLFSCMM